MRLTTTLQIAFFSSFLALAGCSKDSTDTPPPAPAKTRTELLTGVKWKLVSAVGTPEDKNLAPIDVLARLPPCKRDNTIQFNLPDVSIVTEGQNRCPSNDPNNPYRDEHIGKWYFFNKDTEIEIDNWGRNDTMALLIIEVTETTLKLGSVYNVGFTPYQVVETYQKM